MYPYVARFRSTPSRQHWITRPQLLATRHVPGRFLGDRRERGARGRWSLGRRAIGRRSLTGSASLGPLGPLGPLALIALLALLAGAGVRDAPVGPPLAIAANSTSMLATAEDVHAPLLLADQFGGAIASIAVDADHAYVAVGPRMVVLALPDEGDPTLLASSDVLPGRLVEIVVRDDLAIAGYGVEAASERNGLAIWDLRAPEAPVLLSTIAMPGEPIGLWHDGVRLWVATRAHGRDWGGDLVGLDLSLPAEPRITSRTRLEHAPVAFSGGGSTVFVLGGSTPRPNGQTYGQLELFDVSARNLPRRMGHVASGNHVGSGADLAMGDGYLYMVDSGFGGSFTVVDVRDVKKPRMVAQANFQGKNLSKIGDLLYVSGAYSRARVLDLHRPEAPRDLGSLSFVGHSFVATGEMILAISGATIHAHRAGTDPLTAVRTGGWNSFSGVGGLAAEGDSLLADIGTRFIATIGVDAHGARFERDRIVWPSSDGYGVGPVRLVAGTNFAASTWNVNSSVQLVRKDDDGLPDSRVGSTIRLPQTGDIAPMGTHLVVGEAARFESFAATPEPESGKLRVFDTADPSAATLVGSAPAPADIVGIDVRDQSAYVASKIGLFVYDLSHPESPELVYRTDEVVADKGYVYGRNVRAGAGGVVVPLRDGVAVFDLRAPQRPRLLGTVPGRPGALAIGGNVVYVVAHAVDDESDSSYRMISAYDLSSLERGPIARYEMPSGILDILLHREHLIVATEETGLYWLHAGDRLPRPSVDRLWLPIARTMR